VRQPAARNQGESRTAWFGQNCFDTVLCTGTQRAQGAREEGLKHPQGTAKVSD
jgi:hypothetical protein